MGNPRGNPNPSPGTRFLPGISGNPSGKPKGARSLTTLLREAASKQVLMGKHLNGLDAAEALTESMFYHAIMGNVGYAKEILERLEGKVPNAAPDRDDTAKDAALEEEEELRKAERHVDRDGNDDAAGEDPPDTEGVPG